MSLVEMKQTDVVKKLYVYKLSAFSGALTSMLMIQLFGILLSFAGVNNSSGGSSFGLSIEAHFYNSDFVLIFTMIWSAVTAILITTKSYRYGDYSFVSNHLSSHLSNMLFLLTASVIGGFSAVFSGFLVKDVMYYANRSHFYIHEHAGLSAFTAGIIAAILYVLMFCSIGYLIGVLVQIQKGLAIVIPTLILGGLILGSRVQIMQKIFSFFYDESSIFLLMLKTLMITGILFTVSVMISNRLEVKK